MCIALIAYKYHLDFPLIILSNRDEFHNRPTKYAHFWEDIPYILAGRDLDKGGTWFGINKKNGKIALITNFRGPGEMDPKKESRGELVVNFLKEDMEIEEYLSKIKKRKNIYNGYNLILGTTTKLYYFNSVKDISLPISPGIHVLSNGTLDEMWPKCRRLKKLFLNTIDKSYEISINSFLNILTDTTTFPDDELPDTGVGKKLERFLSPIFIKDLKYGTRTSTVLIIDKNNLATFVERTFIPGTCRVYSKRRFQFQTLLV